LIIFMLFTWLYSFHHIVSMLRAPFPCLQFLTLQLNVLVQPKPGS
jgi:hypothetical protein